MSEPVPTDRIRVFDKSGYPVTEFNAAFDRSWAINEEGRGEFKLATRDTVLCSENNFRYGNWILVENSILPPWVGMLDTPRHSSALEMTFAAYTPEHLFSQRIAPIDQTNNYDPGGWFRWFIGFSNTVSLTILQVGTIYHDNDKISKQVCPRYLSEYLKDIIEESAQEYEFVPQINNGRLSIVGNWAQTLGVDTQAMLTSEAGNIEAGDPLITDDGPLANDIFVFGDGASWASRPRAKAWDQENIARYGIRHFVHEATGVTKKSTLQTIANNMLAKMKLGVKVLSLNAINTGNIFQSLKNGNRLNARLTSSDFGYYGKARITGMSYEPLIPNKVALVMEVV